MTITQNILVPTDFSAAARYGIVKAAELAREVGAKVTLCHVLDPSPLTPFGEPDGTHSLGPDAEKAIHAALTQILEEHFADVPQKKTAIIMSQSAAEGICSYAEKEATDLIVVSTHGRTGLAHLLIGSVAERLVRHAPCPVLSVRAIADAAG